MVLFVRISIVVLILLSASVFALDSRGLKIRTGAPSVSKATVTLPNFKELVNKLSHSVVNVSVKFEADSEKNIEDDMPEFFLPPEGEIRSVGSGFIVSEDGYIATNFHVIKDAVEVHVLLHGAKENVKAKLIGKDEKTDIALLKIDTKDSLKPVYFGNSDKIDVGEWVLAIGNQFQLGQTVTAGIVSAKSRRVPSKISGPYDNYIQTDASINPGSSGGPLFNQKGQVIGINTAIFSPGRSRMGGSGFNIGIGFAIPINFAKSIILQLSKSGEVTRGVLGVVIQGVDRELASVLNADVDYGAVVVEVRPNSPAFKAGFKAKDIIVEYNGIKIDSHTDLPLLVAQTKINGIAKVKVLRRGRVKELLPKISKLTNDFFGLIKESSKVEFNKLGFRVSELSNDIREELNINGNEGVFIVDVAKNSIAQAKGIIKGDVLIELNNKKINSKSDLNDALNSLPTKKPFLAVIKKKIGVRFITLSLNRS